MRTRYNLEKTNNKSKDRDSKNLRNEEFVDRKIKLELSENFKKLYEKRHKEETIKLL